MPKRVSVYGRQFLLSGSEADDYYRHLVDGSDLTDAVLRAVRPHVGEDAVCLDIGANIGVYGLGLSVLAPKGRVLAFEPSPTVFDCLRDNVVSNRVPNVECFQTALADREGTIGFHEVPFFTAGSFTAGKVAQLSSEAVGSSFVEVPCATVDSFLREHDVDRVDVVKIDVEGAELAVLDGARETLAGHSPVVVMEFNSFGYSLHQGVLPQVALARIQETFPHVFVIDRVDGSLARMSTPGEAYQFLYINGVLGPADNLLCTFTDLPVEQRLSFPDAVGRALLSDPSASAELAAMRQTLSWRVTAPLRSVRAQIDRSPTVRRWLRNYRR